MVQPEPLPPSFFLRDTLAVARNLLGKHLYYRSPEGLVGGRIVETEAYHQDGDEAAHSFRGKTPRNAVMFGPPGHLYVYYIYGMHYCMNVVTEKEGIGAAVLIRGMEPVVGLDLIRANRGPKVRGKNLTNGPAKCCAAFGIDKNHDGLPLLGPLLVLADGEKLETDQMATSTRIGISKSADLPWRFFIRGNRHVSR